MAFQYKEITNKELIDDDDDNDRASVLVQLVKNLPAVQETQVRFLGWEDALHKEMTTPSSILAWRIPLIEKPGGLQSLGCKELDTTEQLTLPPPGQCPHSHSFMSSAWLNSTELSNS